MWGVGDKCRVTPSFGLQVSKNGSYLLLRMGVIVEGLGGSKEFGFRLVKFEEPVIESQMVSLEIRKV